MAFYIWTKSGPYLENHNQNINEVLKHNNF